LLTKSKIFLYFCLSFILGVFFESLINFPLAMLGGFFVLGLISVSVFWQSNKKFVIISFCLMIFALGAYRYIQKSAAGDLASYNDKGILVLKGTVVEPPDQRPTSQKLIIAAEAINDNGREINAQGFVLATVKAYPLYNYGDKLELSGQLKEPANLSDFSNSAGQSFDYKSYLAKSDIYSVMSFPQIRVSAHNKGSKIKTVLFQLKNKFESAINNILPEPQASYLAGLTLGVKKSLPQDLTTAFQKTGTTHIIALSGYNIGLVSAFFMIILGWFMLKRNWQFWVAAVGIIFFTILTGASASVVRAAIMGVLVLLALNQGRIYNCRNALVFAGAVMVYLSPKILRFDVGFQLSFGAMAGLIWLTPIFQKWLQNWPKAFGLKEIFIATLSAQLAVLPLLVIYFGQLSLISPVVNLLILLFIPQTMLLGFLAGVAGMIWLLAGKIFGWVVWLFLTFELAVIKFFASLPLASVKMNWGWTIAMIYYVILVLFLYRFYFKQKSVILVEQWADKLD